MLEKESLECLNHKIEKVNKIDTCIRCKRRVWSDDFPNYCQGETSLLSLEQQETNQDVYSVNAEILHLHNRVVIEFDGQCGDHIFFDMQKDEVASMIKKFQKIHDSI